MGVLGIAFFPRFFDNRLSLPDSLLRKPNLCRNREMRKILLTTFGSYGDLHPYLAMARVLKANGDEVTIATHADYQEQVERIGCRFVPVKPGLMELGPQHEWAKKANHWMRGTEFIIQSIIMPYLEDGYHAIKQAAVGQDLIISHILCFATPMVADELKIPWISTVLQPATFFSAYDPPELGFFNILPKLKFLGPKKLRWVMNTLAKGTDKWLKPIHEFRREHGFPPEPRNVLVNGFSPFGTLALFSSSFLAPQPDWPANTKQIGFPFFDEETTSELSPETKAFLEAGPAPVIFTLGTAVVLMETPFYEIAYRAVKDLGLRAVFLVGKNPQRVPAAAMTDPQIHVSAYEPFSKLFPHGSAIVHQCGIGTTAQALASGQPQVTVPFAHDQPDNARRIVELGCGVKIKAAWLSVQRMKAALSTVTQSVEVQQCARSFAAHPQVDGFGQGLRDAIEFFLANREKATRLVTT